ncbi:MAG: hypothetical protein AAF823_13430, partial [Planctomycetota bacterium]
PPPPTPPADPDPLDDALRAHYAAKRPSPEAMSAFKVAVATESPAVIAAVAPAAPRSRTARLGWAVAGVAAAIALVVFLGSFVSPADNGLTNRVHAQIALNHRKDLASEWQTHDIAALCQTMDKLVFDLKLPDAGPLEGTRLLGGRYCSIDGELAAQLHLVGADDRPCTLYVVRDAPEFATLAAADSTQADVHVTTWRADGLVFGLARTLTR